MGVVVATAALLLMGCSPTETGSISNGAETATPAAVSLAPSPSPTPIPTVAATPTETPRQPAVAGANIDELLAFLVAHNLECERDRSPAGPDPPPDLIGALCTGTVSASGANLQVQIAYWPDGGIVFVEGNTCCNGVQPADRAAWLGWFAEIPYEGSDPIAIENWLQGNTLAACSQGCEMIFGGAKWFHVVGLNNSDQVSFGPLP